MRKFDKDNYDPEEVALEISEGKGAVIFPRLFPEEIEGDAYKSG